LGYRKYGHNEGDEPRFTQPTLYQAISKHKNPRDIYAAQLIDQGIISQADIKQMEKEYKDSLEIDLEDSRKIEKTEITPFMQDEWKGFVRVDESEMMQPVKTAVNKKTLTNVAKAIT
ncbi:MAG: thiamine pyrophosphate-dependent enzyme, partial [Flavobacteriaceae bacterium]